MRTALGIDIGGTDIKLGIVDEAGKILESGTIPTRAAEGPRAAALRIDEWYRRSSGADPGVSAAGADCAGLIDGSRGWLYVSPNLPGWGGIDLASLLREALRLPVTLDNDVNCAAWGEYLHGAGRGTEHFICITLGTGIGGGVVIGGRLYRGWQGLAGEVGHQVVTEAGPMCTCGTVGCLEAAANAASIVRRARDLIADGGASVLPATGPLTAREVFEAATRGDRVALEALAMTGRALGRGLANLVHLFNPEVIAVGGGVAGAGELILAPAREAMREMLMDEVLAEVRIVPAALGNSASLVGASMMAFATAER
jgi:glucokinase